MTDAAITLVLCNAAASCRMAEHVLVESGIMRLCYHGDLASGDR